MATFFCFFTSSKQGKTGLTVTADIYSASGMLASGQACTEIGGGLYTGILTAAQVAALTAAMAAL